MDSLRCLFMASSSLSHLSQCLIFLTAWTPVQRPEQGSTALCVLSEWGQISFIRWLRRKPLPMRYLAVLPDASWDCRWTGWCSSFWLQINGELHGKSLWVPFFWSCSSALRLLRLQSDAPSGRSAEWQSWTQLSSNNNFIKQQTSKAGLLFHRRASFLVSILLISKIDVTWK